MPEIAIAPSANKFDLMTKLRLKAFAAKTVNIAQQTEKLTAQKEYTHS